MSADKINVKEALLVLDQSKIDEPTSGCKQAVTSKLASPSKEPIKLVTKFSKIKTSGEQTSIISTENRTPGDFNKKSHTVEMPQG